jgi:hypothetical protein
MSCCLYKVQSIPTMIMRSARESYVADARGEQTFVVDGPFPVSPFLKSPLELSGRREDWTCWGMRGDSRDLSCPGRPEIC